MSRLPSAAILSFVVAVTVVAVPAAMGQGLFREHKGAPGDRLGVGLATAGDVDHDGIDDYAIGAPYENVSTTASGVARVHSGATGAVMWKFVGTTHGEFGWSVDGGGDVDADGTPDVIVGSDGINAAQPNAGMAQVFSGSTGVQLFAIGGEKANNQFGHDLAFVGDIDLDGHVDFAVGAPRLLSDTGVYPSGIPGKVVAFSGKTGTELYSWVGGVPSDAFGVDVSAAGDANGDGRPDVLVGAWGWSTGPGNAYLFSGAGGGILHQKTGTYPGQNFGLSVDGVGDVDNDGRADFAVGASGWDAVLLGWPVAGEVMVYSGATGANLLALHGDAPRDLFGSQVAGLGDANGDGALDLAVCTSPYDVQTGFFGGGSVRVHSLKTGALLHEYPVAGSIDYDMTAFVNSAGDVNGDGLQDLLVGAHVANDGGVEAGKAQLLWIGNADCGSLAAFGTSCPGSGGSAPQLAITGCPTAGGFMTLSIANGPPSSVALLAIGFSQAVQPIGGGCTWYLGSAPVLLGPLPLGGLGPGQGGFSLAAMLPLNTPPMTLFHQAIVLDPGAPLGFTTTNGVKEVIQ